MSRNIKKQFRLSVANNQTTKHQKYSLLNGGKKWRKNKKAKVVQRLLSLKSL